MNIVLTGFMATGKTEIGKELAKGLGWPYIDTDAMIEKDTGCPIKEIFAKNGELYFREVETRAVRCVAMLDKSVIATGGGVVLRKENMDELEKNGVVICLTASPEVILERTSQLKTRPLLLNTPDPLGKIKELLTLRSPFYKRADWTVDTSVLKVSESVGKIREFLRAKGLIPHHGL